MDSSNTPPTITGWKTNSSTVLPANDACQPGLTHQTVYVMVQKKLPLKLTELTLKTLTNIRATRISTNGSPQRDLSFALKLKVKNAVLCYVYVQK